MSTPAASHARNAKRQERDVQPMIEIVRAGLVESSHIVSLAVSDVNGKLAASWGNPELRTFLRSSAKPFQALPTVAEGAADTAGFSEIELALMCASHAGTDRHAELAAGMLAKIGCTAANLKCGIHTPYDAPTAEALIRHGSAPDTLRNNCSGKHSGMLALAQHLGAPLETYLELDHPVQQLILKYFTLMTDLPLNDIVIGTDGCSAPNFAIPLRLAAMAYARLVDPSDLDEPVATAARRLVAAMTAYPEVVSGAGRFDTELMRVTSGRLLSKGGAEGYQCIGIPAGSLGHEHPAFGLALKVLDGDLGHRAGSAATLQVLHELGAISPDERAALSAFDARELQNLAGLPTGALRISASFGLERFRDELRER